MSQTDRGDMDTPAESLRVVYFLHSILDRVAQVLM